MSTTPTSPPGVWRSWGWSIALHVVVAALAVLGVMSWRESEPVAQRLAIEAHVVSAAPSRPTQRPPPPEVVPVPEPVSEPEPVPQPDPEEIARKKEQAEATARREEEQRVLARKAEEARLLEVREREEKQKAREKEQQEKAAREKAEREKAAVDKERQLREAELNAQIAAEERLAAARASGKMDQYVAQITARIESKWIRPPSARSGLECEVSVTQAPGGTVVSARVTRCNGDDAVRESIAAAVLRASPLPLPADAALFERNLVVTFRPED